MALFTTFTCCEKTWEVLNNMYAALNTFYIIKGSGVI